MKLSAGWLFAIFLVFSMSTFAAETATTVREVDLKKTPAPDAETVGTLPAQTAVEIVQRQGGWNRVKAGSQQGWVRLLSLKLSAKAGETTASSASGGGFFASLFGFGGKSASSGGSATAGIRGLSEEELQNAQPNAAELAKLDGYKASTSEARHYAQQQRLKAQSVEFVVDGKEPQP